MNFFIDYQRYKIFIALFELKRNLFHHACFEIFALFPPVYSMRDDFSCTLHFLFAKNRNLILILR